MNAHFDGSYFAVENRSDFFVFYGPNVLGHPDNYMLVCEEVLYAHPGMTGTYDYRIRADMVYFTTPKNGAVFSTGAIAFGQALPCDNFANNASKVLKNVVDAFSKAVNLPGSAWVSEEKQWR